MDNEQYSKEIKDKVMDILANHIEVSVTDRIGNFGKRVSIALMTRESTDVIKVGEELGKYLAQTIIIDDPKIAGNREINNLPRKMVNNILKHIEDKI